MVILLLALLAVVLFGLGFVVKWLFIAAAIALLLALIAGVTSRSGMRT